ncbi:MAG: ATP synthase F0 subunit B, partial [Planctomycetes bacterium]|nr:ATP synthase F0 subunit B [Planctomycetota bacterium]
MTLTWQLVLFEVLNFCILVAILGRFLYRPVRRMLRERREQIEGVREQAEAREREALATQAEYEARRVALEREAETLRAEGRARGEEAAERVLSEARETARLERDRAADDLARSERRALEALRDEVLELAVSAAGRVLAGLELPDVASAYARLAGERLRAQSGDQPLAALRVELSPDADPERVRGALRDVLGEDAQLELSTDPQLV